MNMLESFSRFRKARASIGELQTRETWSRGQIESFQLERLNRLWLNAAKNTAFHRELSRTFHLPREFESLEHFQAVYPILHKREVRNRKLDFLSDVARKGEWSRSGGSTGTPTSYFRSHESHQELLRGRYCAHAAWGLDIFDRWGFLWGHAASFPPNIGGFIERCKRPIHDLLRNRFRLSAYDLSPKNMRGNLDLIAKYRPAAIYAYSTAGYMLAREAKAIGFHCPSLKLMVLTAEPVLPQIVSECEAAFGVPAVAEYGSTETSTLAFELPDRKLRVREDNFFVETPCRQDGRYDIVVTVLNSEDFPFIRYAIGDVTDFPLRRPEIGFAYLGNVAGRLDDIIVTRSGKPLFAGWFESVLEQDESIRRFRVHQSRDGDLEVMLELDDPSVPPSTSRFTKIFSKAIGFKVCISFFEELPSTLSGKHCRVSSDLAKEKEMILPTYQPSK